MSKSNLRKSLSKMKQGKGPQPQFDLAGAPIVVSGQRGAKRNFPAPKPDHGRHGIVLGNAIAAMKKKRK